VCEVCVSCDVVGPVIAQWRATPLCACAWPHAPPSPRRTWRSPRRSATGALVRASPLTSDLPVIAFEQGVGGLRGRVDDGLGHASDDVVDGREMDIETSLMDARDHDGREQTFLGAVMGEHDVTELEPLAHDITLRVGDPLQVSQ